MLHAKVAEDVVGVLWLGLVGLTTGCAQLVVMVAHLRRLAELAAAQTTGISQWAELGRELRASLDANNSWRGRVAALNDATSTVEQWLNHAHVRPSGWRICAASGIAAGCAMLSITAWGAAGCFIWALASAAGAAWVGRRADSISKQIRVRWNAYIRSLARAFPDDSVGLRDVRTKQI